MQGHADQDRVGGVAWLAACGDEVEVGGAGCLTRGEPRAVGRDSLFRIASMTKPVVAVGALRLIEECRLRLDDPIDELLPELADRRVLVNARGPLDGDTVPAHRPITVHDVLTFRLGIGTDFEAPWPQPLLDAMADLGLGAGPPEPQLPPGPDEWMRRLSTLPLIYQPGERWLYNTGADVLGVLDRPGGRPAVGRVPLHPGVRTVGHDRHRFLDGRSRSARFLLRDQPRHRGPEGLRPSRRPVDLTTRVPVGRRWPGLDARRHACLRPDAVGRRTPAERLAPAVGWRRSRR